MLMKPGVQYWPQVKYELQADNGPIFNSKYEQNRADIITGEDGTATINVHRVYENKSGTPVQITGQVRSGSSPWTDIQL